MTLLMVMVLAVQPHRLDSRRESGADGCPDEQALQRAVAERLGSSPFSPDATRTVTVRWRVENGTYSSELTVASETGATVGSRKLTSSSSDCAELASSTALALALILDPLSLTRPTPEPLPTPPPPPTVSDQPPETAPPLVIIERPAPTAPGPAREKVRPFWFGAGAGVSVGEVPSVSAAIELNLAWRSTWVLFGARVSFVAPGSQRFDVGSVNAMLFGIGPVLCIGSTRVGGCATARVGVTHAWATGFEPALQYAASAATVAFGLGPYVDFAPIDFLRLRLFVTGQVQPAAAVLVVKGLEAWRTPIVSLQAGGAVFAVP